MIKRRKTRQIKVGNVKIGGNATISIQSMAKTDTRDVKTTVRQIKELQRAGCQIVRVAVKDIQAAGAIARIKPKINIPLVADIHFDYRLALTAIESGADKIRFNPGNITDKNHIKMIADAAKRQRIPV
jgi:(E)-4-hydroxy-3-methylbut-2-enyl-diphosphate synthase